MSEEFEPTLVPYHSLHVEHDETAGLLLIKGSDPALTLLAETIYELLPPFTAKTPTSVEEEFISQTTGEVLVVRVVREDDDT